MYKNALGGSAQFGNAGRLPGPALRETRVRSCVGSHVGGEDVVGVAVQVLAGSVILHSRARIRVAPPAIWTSLRSTPASKLVVTKV